MLYISRAAAAAAAAADAALVTRINCRKSLNAVYV